MNRDHIEPYKEFVQAYYMGRDPAHDFCHIKRIISRLASLSEGVSTPPRWDRLYFLASFHGLWRLIRDDITFRDKTTIFLRGLGWEEREIMELFESLERHLKAPMTVEEEIIHDADYLELLGAFGIAKAFTTGGAAGQSYEQTADIFEHQYLNKVEFQTPVGRRLAEEKKLYTKDFLKRLREEL